MYDCRLNNYNTILMVFECCYTAGRSSSAILANAMARFSPYAPSGSDRSAGGIGGISAVSEEENEDDEDDVEKERNRTDATVASASPTATSFSPNPAGGTASRGGSRGTATHPASKVTTPHDSSVGNGDDDSKLKTREGGTRITADADFKASPSLAAGADSAWGSGATSTNGVAGDSSVRTDGFSTDSADGVDEGRDGDHRQRIEMTRTKSRREGMGRTEASPSMVRVRSLPRGNQLPGIFFFHWII